MFIYTVKRYLFLFFAFVLVLSSCVKEIEPIEPGLPPDYVEPADPIPDTGYNWPQVGSDGRILVLGQPQQYTDTATMHVISVAYDIAASKPFDITAYYAAAVGKKGVELKEAIAKIITDNYIGISYGDLREKINIADQDPLNHDNVWLFYKEGSVNGTWDSGKSWNREHVWAQSRGLSPNSGNTDNNTISLASDFHNLKAEDPGVNSEKGNRDFETNASDASFIGTHGTYSYSPALSARGDVARILCYMQLRWGQSNGLVLDDKSENSPSYDEAYRRQGKISDLLKWHTVDPVDPFEIRRNNVVYQYQKNRNPFVDHPELVEYIFGNKQSQVWDGGIVYSLN